MRKMPPASMADVTGKYLGKPFAEIPCLELVRRIYRDDLGIDFPEAFEGITKDDFLARWRADRRGLEQIMLRFFETLGEPVEGRPRRWDLLALQGRTAVFPAVYTGRGKAITSGIRDGVALAPLVKPNDVIMVRRLF